MSDHTDVRVQPAGSEGGRCPECTAGVDHCHGTLLLHDDGTEECSTPGCCGWWERHDLRVHCAELDRCFCEPSTRLPARLAA